MRGLSPSKWDRRFLAMADFVSKWSKDPSTQVGAIIVRPNRTLASVGFNGFPRGVEDRAERLNDREVKYAMTVHAEANAILAANEPVNGYTLYVSPLFPCANCAALIIQSGIKTVVAAMPPGENERWNMSFKMAEAMFAEAAVNLIRVERV